MGVLTVNGRASVELMYEVPNGASCPMLDAQPGDFIYLRMVANNPLARIRTREVDEETGDPPEPDVQWFGRNHVAVFLAYAEQFDLIEVGTQEPGRCRAWAESGNEGRDTVAKILPFSARARPVPGNPAN